MRYLILGNGVAGTYAAKTISEKDSEAEILIISAERTPFYSRPRLPQIVAGEVNEQDVVLFSDDWYDEKRIKLRLGEEVVAINPQEHQVKTVSDVYSYDRLLLALGSRPNLPPIEGLDGDGVYTLRSLDDALNLNRLSAKYQQALLIGGGLLGLEAGYGLIKAGMKVTVIEFFDRLLPRQMDQEGADLLESLLADMGFRFFLGVTTESVSGSTGSMALKLKDSETVRGDLVIVSAGIRSNVEIPLAAGIACNRGVIVDERMRTNLTDIYAAGDLAEFEGRVYGLWPAGMDQGIAAASNMVGDEKRYQGTTPSTALKVAGISFSSFGQIADFENAVREQKKVDSTGKSYAKIFLDQGKIMGGIFLNQPKLARTIQKLCQTETSVLGYEEKLLTDTFDFSIFK